ncbi:MAG TPA: ferrous iron transport protein B, partial [Candidatus Polarisedimenticolaceae bacterium]|nr:ferrous iron transport protein B [Candidatus Polarisedimenticolaceae bacterium]
MSEATQRAARPHLAPRRVAILGNPNTGKTTIFNALTGLSQKVANYPGVTVERKAGKFVLGGRSVELVDLPGTYSLAARSLDEAIAVDVLLGRLPGEAPIDAVVAVVDAGNLDRNLFLVSQLLELSLPTVVALNMMDGAARRGIEVDAEALSTRLGVPVVPLRADRGEGVEALKAAIDRVLLAGEPAPVPRIAYPHALRRALDQLVPSARRTSRPELLRALVDVGGPAEQRLTQLSGAFCAAQLVQARREALAHGPLAGLESAARYAWVRAQLEGSVVKPEVPRRTLTERIDAVLTHRVLGLLVLVLALGSLFQALYLGAAPLVDGIDWIFGRLSDGVAAVVPDGPLQSLLLNGVLGGAGSVVAFLPQILILFLFLSILEDCGYMARVAFLVDRLLAWTGVSGRAVIPLLSSFACAVPGVMAARTIENRRDRLATILVAPLMSCSARLPVYSLLIGAFVPATSLWGWLGMQGLFLLGAHLIGLLVALFVLVLTRRTVLRGEAAPFVLELPDYRWPSWLSIADRLLIRARAFLVRAGTVIAAVGILVWALSYFPRPAAIHEGFEAQRATAPTAEARAALDGAESAAYLEQSFLGRAGHVLEPAVRPLGWDWRIGVSVLASFPAREVVIATTATILGLGSDEDPGAIAQARRPDGTPLFTLPIAVSLIVFFALCCQCAATLAVIRRETGSWRWPLLTFGYMTVLAYVAALGAYHLTTWITA